jgi:hypothetical protein
MNALNASFGFKIADRANTLSLREGEHFRIYPTEKRSDFGEGLTARQIDLIRVATAVHIADGWVRRLKSQNRLRSPTLEVEVLDMCFWSSPVTLSKLKGCVDFLSGGDDWTFCFIPSRDVRHYRRVSLFRGHDDSALVSPYSGGLDSASGLAARLSRSAVVFSQD